jgi:hypothetical protein
MTINCVSGDSHIIVKIGGNVSKIKIEHLYDYLANSPKYTKTCTDGKEAYVRRKQIQKDILQSDGKKVSNFGRDDGKTSHNTEMLRRDERFDQHKSSSNKSSFVGTSSFDENGKRRQRIKETLVRISQNVVRKAINALKPPRRKKKLYQKTDIGTKENRENWNETFDPNERKDIKSSSWEKSRSDVRRNETKTFFIEERESQVGRAQKEYFQSQFWEKEKSGTCGKDKQQSRKNTKNSRKTSGDEKVRRDENQNEPEGERSSSVEQRIEVYTKNGFKPFDGICRTTTAQKTSRVQLLASSEEFVTGRGSRKRVISSIKFKPITTLRNTNKLSLKTIFNFRSSLLRILFSITFNKKYNREINIAVIKRWFVFIYKIKE